jgi:hypothetical protein
MPIAASNEAAIRIIEEATLGTLPATPALQELRFTGETIIPVKDTVVSAVIRSDRQRDFLAEVAARAEGDLEIEPAYGEELKILLEGVLWSDIRVTDSGDGSTTGVTTLTVVAATRTVGEAGGTFIDDGFHVGATINLSGFLAGEAANNGDYEIESLTQTTLVVTEGVGDQATMVDASGTGAETMASALNTYTVVDAARTFTRAAGDHTVDGFKVGQWIEFSGFSDSGGANNGVYRIEDVSALVITVEAGFGNEPSMIDETGGGDERAFGQWITNGTVAHSYSIEKEFDDISEWIYLRGMRMGGLSLNVTVGEIVTGTVSFMGIGNPGDPASNSSRESGATTVAADTTTQLNATENVGNLFEGGVALTTCLNSISIEVTNNLRAINCVGSKYPSEINAGWVDVTGTLEAYFTDEALFDAFIQHDQSSLIFSLTDGDGNMVFVTLPRIYFGSGSPASGGGNEDILLPMEITAIREQVTDGQTIQFDLIPATLP